MSARTQQDVSDPGSWPRQILAHLDHGRGVLHSAVVSAPLETMPSAERMSALALIGPSGCGKSTVAAMLQRRGWFRLADDLALLELHSGGLPEHGALAPPRWTRDLLAGNDRRDPKELMAGVPVTTLVALTLGDRQTDALPPPRRLSGAFATAAILAALPATRALPSEQEHRGLDLATRIARGTSVYRMPVPPGECRAAAETLHQWWQHAAPRHSSARASRQRCATRKALS